MSHHQSHVPPNRSSMHVPVPALRPRLQSSRSSWNPQIQRSHPRQVIRTQSKPPKNYGHIKPAQFENISNPPPTLEPEPETANANANGSEKEEDKRGTKRQREKTDDIMRKKRKTNSNSKQNDPMKEFQRKIDEALKEFQRKTTIDAKDKEHCSLEENKRLKATIDAERKNKAMDREKIKQLMNQMQMVTQMNKCLKEEIDKNKKVLDERMQRMKQMECSLNEASAHRDEDKKKIEALTRDKKGLEEKTQKLNEFKMKYEKCKNLLHNFTIKNKAEIEKEKADSKFEKVLSEGEKPQNVKDLEDIEKNVMEKLDELNDKAQECRSLRKKVKKLKKERDNYFEDKLKNDKMLVSVRKECNEYKSNVETLEVQLDEKEYEIKKLKEQTNHRDNETSEQSDNESEIEEDDSMDSDV